MNNEIMGYLGLVVFLTGIFLAFGFMLYDQKKQQEKHKKKG